MILLIIFLVFVFFICAYLVGRKVYNERKIKNRQMELPGKIVLITGASSGIGEALAHKFYASGCKVILAARRISELERVRRDLLNLELQDHIKSIRPDIVPLDLAELSHGVEKINFILNACPNVDILVNNAGVSMISGVRTVKQEIDERVMNVNYFGTIALTKAFLPAMVERKQGVIVFVGSVVGRFAIPHCSSYTASKHALQGFADCLRSEVAEHNVKVMVSNPGYVATEITKNALTGEGRTYGATNRAIANGQTPQDCANDIFRAVLRGDNEFTPIKFLTIVWLRSLCPSVYFSFMEKRARKFEARKNVTHIV